MKNRTFKNQTIAFIMMMIVILSFSSLFAGSISGQITTSESSPVPASRVFLLNAGNCGPDHVDQIIQEFLSRHGNDNPNQVYVLSDPNGMYSFDEVQTGSYIVFAQKEGFMPAPYTDGTAEVSVVEVDADDQEVVGINIQLTLPPNPNRPGRVNGMVVNSQNQPVPFIEIKLADAATDSIIPFYHGNSNWNGYYMINRIDYGTYKTVALNHMTQEILGYSAQFTISEDDFIVDSINIVVDMNMNNYSVSGSIGTANNMPGHGHMRHVVLFGQAADTTAYVQNIVRHANVNPSGEFTINNVPNGTYKLKMHGFHGMPIFYPGTTNIEEAVEIVVNDANVENLNFNFNEESTYTLAGIVKAAETELPLEGITVTVDLFGNCHNPFADSTFASISTLTDINGAYSIEVPFGFYNIAAIDTNGVYRTQYYDHVQNPFQARVIRAFHDYDDLNFDLLPVATETDFSISGTITVNGEIPNAPVLVIAVSSDEDWEESIITDQFGHYNIPVNTPGDYYIIASSPMAPMTYYQNSQTWEDAQTINVSSHVENIDFDLNYASTNGINQISGNVTIDGRQALSNVSLTVKNTDGDIIAFARTNEDGDFTLVNIPNENIQVIASIMGYQSVSENMTVTGDETISYTMTSALSNDNTTTPMVKTQINNYPNPFNPSTTISFTLANDEQVSLDIYNIKGQKVKSFFNEKMTKGNHQVVWNGKDNNNKDVTSGIYFAKVKGQMTNATRKMLLIK